MKAFELFKLSHNIKKMLGEERREKGLVRSFFVCLCTCLRERPSLFTVRMVFQH